MSAFRPFFEREKLTGDNFNDCCMEREYKIHSDVACLMLGRMSPALQRQFELYFPQAMLDELRRMFEKPQAVEIYDLVDSLHSCKQAPGKSKLQYALVGKIVSDLHALLIDYEKGLKRQWPLPQGFRVERKLSYGEQYLHVGNGAQAAVEAIGVFNLVFTILFSLAHIGKTCMAKASTVKDFWKVSMRDRYDNGNLEVELQLGKKIKALRSDRGGEYLSQEFKEYLGLGCESGSSTEINDVVGDLGEPANYKAAMLDPDKVIWQGAMDEEMNSMKVNEVWIEVDPPPNAKIVRSKWLFKKKTDMDGEVHTYKARLVVVGFTQTYGIDYEETFSNVADIRDIKILIAIATYYDYEIWQMDVKTAFLNGRLDEDIYMVQPEGASGSNVVFLILYVDDILIMGNNIPRLKEVKDYIGKCFSMKDLGEAAYILGIKIYRDRSKRLIGLSQSAYIEKNIKEIQYT
ncbi:retrotransposon protein, putative, ty1-copia subclass [Tanacetum coccineum]